ncbi:ADA HAT complex component 1 [Madurella fahalii]|uniref:ADA HAT complex component 1 n=1 Tax=Madurella fahalii TaxID=1157608 RepID=A0ABQ0GEQ5_9PEZI
MPVFRFWGSDSRGSDKTVEQSHRLPDCAEPFTPHASGLPTPISPKKRRPSFVDTAACVAAYPPAKRFKAEQNGGLPSPTSASADGEEASMLRRPSKALDLESAREVIQYQFGLEVLLKHDELRLINQELAKCQIALEQLRRCHLIPYPVQCPTPSQMLEISSGKGPALQPPSGRPVPKWAPPFGVVEGPYARHYAKWLIPDPMFDGIQPEAQGVPETGRAKGVVAEGRTTRNSMPDAGGSLKQRSVRGQAGQRLQSLSSGYAQPKDKQAPCILKRSDGLTVKLVCIDCQRWDFSSTQGFINHCRIAHRRDFKSHEEAAVHCGHPIEVDESGAIVGDNNKTSPSGGAASGLVHALSVSDGQAYKALLSRINASLALYKANKLPNASCKPGTTASAPTKTGASRSNFVGSSDAPYLSQLMQKKKLGGNLRDQVTEAKTKVDLDWLSPGEESDLEQPSTTDGSATPDKPSAPMARTPAVMRMPARCAVSPSQPSAIPRPASSKSHVAAPTDAGSPPEIPETPMYDDDIDVDLSPNTMTSNNAPSLVSDDGEYDDDSSDDGSASDSNCEDNLMETESVSDVAEINIDDDDEGGRRGEDGTPRPIPRGGHHRRRGSATSSAVKLKKDGERHVTFVTPTPAAVVPKPGNGKGRRKTERRV